MTAYPPEPSSAADELTLYTPAEVAALTRISRTNVYALIASGEISSMKFGKRDIRVPHAALRKYIEDRCALAG